jgi:hypothetical protein
VVCSSVSSSPYSSHLTPHSSPTNISSSSSRPHSYSQLDTPQQRSPQPLPLRFAWALQEDLISFGSQKETPLGGPRTRSRAALLYCLTQSSLARAPHFALQSAGTRPSTSTSLLRNVASYPTLLLDNSTSTSTSTFGHHRPSRRFTIAPSTFLVERRIRLWSSPSLLPLPFLLRRPQGSPQRSTAIGPPVKNSPGARPTPFPNAKHRLSHSHHPNNLGRCCRAYF